MRRVLPRHPDATVQLDAFLRGVHRGAAAVGLRDGRRDRRVRVLSGAGVGRAPAPRPNGRDPDPKTREPMLDGLVGTDGSAELLALLGISKRRLETPLGDAQLFGRE